ncbi:3-deoxy-manno-octulosonate cytidylyltransferase [Campylobacter jejuni]|uniref:3-deoxy-manno-octulosonate cytidylyltransferase n=1 Tax=Campylobacter jejuni TaxID=197 RepID=UPI0020C195DD|nr:3-deoxy-manno-octulosonate cytidylyltransferase [Campylobacter jejuni]
MKIIGVIPARYGSTRFPGKPLADIFGKPMIWWVYQQAIRSKKLTDIIIATDDKKIAEVCKKYKFPYMITREDHLTAANRIFEVSRYVKGDYYIQINGDEPLVDANLIDLVIPKDIPQDIEFGTNIIASMINPIEVVDPSNIKVVCDAHDNIVYMSRTPIPYPYKYLQFDYYKHIGIIGFNEKMLIFYNNSKPLILESIEGIDMLRFTEYNKIFKAILAKKNIHTLSVDTKNDLEKVLKIIENKFESNKLDYIRRIL